MKMNPGSGTISNYSSYVNNCIRNQYPYKIPVNNLQDVQLYIDIGGIKPSAVQYELIHTCGELGGTIETVTPSDYVVGQDPDNYWYGVFKNFSGATPTCFVIAITLTINAVDVIYFSDEYCIEPCRTLTLVKSCYGNLDPEISTDCQDIYFGVHAGEDTAMGDVTVFYEHKVLLRDVEVSRSAIKNTFKQARTRTFRVEKEKIYQFYGEFIPEWYLDEIDAVFSRGEVFIDTDSYLLNETQFEKIEDCKRIWKPSATFKASCFQSFSCEVDPCAAPVAECCDPTGISATVEFEDSGAFCCDPEIINAQVEFESGTGELGLRLLFDDIANADSLVGDSSDVGDWNTFFDTGINADTPFSSVEIISNEVTLFGVTNLTISTALFAGNTSILEVNDDGGHVIIIDGGAFQNCTSLVTVIFPSVTNIVSNSFSGAGLESASFPLSLTVGGNSFEVCPLEVLDLSSCTNLGGTTGDNGVFNSITGQTITLTIPTATATDGDVVTLQSNNTVTLILV